MADGCLVSNKTEKSPRVGREWQHRRLAGCKIHMQRAPNKSCSSYTESSPRLAITFIPIISAVSHPMPDICPLLVNASILSICHMLLCLLGRLCHQELTSITSLKVRVHFEKACLHLNLGKTKCNQTVRAYGEMLGELTAFSCFSGYGAGGGLSWEQNPALIKRRGLWTCALNPTMKQDQLTFPAPCYIKYIIYYAIHRQVSIKLTLPLLLCFTFPVTEGMSYTHSDRGC